MSIASSICEPSIMNGPRRGESAMGTMAGYRRHLRAEESPCDLCQKANTETIQRWRERNPERVNEHARQWKRANSEQVKASYRRWQREHAKQVNEYARQWKRTNPEKVAEYARRSRRNRLDKRREDGRRRNARKAEVLTLPFSTEQLAVKMAYWGDRCWIRIHCDGVPFESVDHVIPIARGGPHVLANLRPACISCNSAKNARRIV